MITRTTSRLVARRALTPAVAATRSFSKIQPQKNAEVVAADKVPMVTYNDGVRSESIVQPLDPGIVNPPGADARKIAIPLEKSILERLTPTLKKFTLVDKVAVVTGGGRGLGYNMAQALAEVGIKGIALMDLNKENGDAAAKELAEETGIDVRFYQVDVRDYGSVTGAVKDVISHYGKIDVLINSAGIADSNIPAENYPHDMWSKLIDVNLNGAFLCAQAVGREMIAQKTGGSIIFIASMSGSIVNYPQEQSCYNASKAGVIHLTKSLAAEWAKYNVRVNAISPGYMDTALNRVPALDAQKKIWIAQTPQKRLGGVDELNNLAVYLASDASSYTTGANMIIDGGYTLW
ncbi:NAD(P)-binding protein [Lepidopterella palustris CBS 459.81]|uniref:NADP-dependent mannitol dehydrogenase n=1 Tax=Lepidopterella palustris CBS 459.81 TaxID=1314670 RepID=A0A8E2JGB4_9PEZI|nr:NAD(P)-binding protein [Lepidopterella palustris CBS 459.81]